VKLQLYFNSMGILATATGRASRLTNQTIQLQGWKLYFALRTKNLDNVY
jgi:hypothetical protein